MIAIFDFGGQYAHLISTRIRSFGVFCEIVNPEIDVKKLEKYKGIILSGGPQSVFDEESVKVSPEIYELCVPVLAICYGHQLTSQILGGEVVPGTKPEYGPAVLSLKKESPLLDKVSSESKVWMSHNDEVIKIPEGFEIIASTPSCEVAAIHNINRNFYCIQFHPEVIHTAEGNQILENFVDICGQKGTWKMKSFIETESEKIRNHIGNKKVFLFVSGGVDSTVAFALLEKALGKDNVFGVYVDTGMMRFEETKYIKSSLKKAGFENLHVEYASDLFLGNLEGKFSPEEKRKIIGNTFLQVQQKVSQRFNLDSDNWILGQGTIYPDTIETGGTKNAETIKTHHNRVPEIQKLIDEGKVIEPLSDLYKDEVRAVGRELGLPDELVDRHPFPGPGLGVRILCSNHSTVIPAEAGIYDIENLEQISQELVTEQLKTKNSKLKTIQVLPIKSVGVQGDGRTYRHPAVIYTDNIDWDVLDDLSVKITNSSKEVNRVVLSLSHTQKQEFSIKESYITDDRIQKLQKADHIAHELLLDYEKTENPKQKVWQFPVVLLPLVNKKGEEVVVLRPIFSQEAMTAEFAKLPPELLKQMSDKILEIDGIGAVFYDLTHKPPGTIEWE